MALVSFGMFIFISQLVGNLYVNYTIMEIITIFRIPVTWILYLKYGGTVFFISFSRSQFQTLVHVNAKASSSNRKLSNK